MKFWMTACNAERQVIFNETVEFGNLSAAIDYAKANVPVEYHGSINITDTENNNLYPTMDDIHAEALAEKLGRETGHQVNKVAKPGKAKAFNDGRAAYVAWAQTPVGTPIPSAPYRMTEDGYVLSTAWSFGFNYAMCARVSTRTMPVETRMAAIEYGAIDADHLEALAEKLVRERLGRHELKDGSSLVVWIDGVWFLDCTKKTKHRVSEMTWMREPEYKVSLEKPAAPEYVAVMHDVQQELNSVIMAHAVDVVRARRLAHLSGDGLTKRTEDIARAVDAVAAMDIERIRVNGHIMPLNVWGKATMLLDLLYRAAMLPQLSIYAKDDEPGYYINGELIGHDEESVTSAIWRMVAKFQEHGYLFD